MKSSPRQRNSKTPSKNSSDLKVKQEASVPLAMVKRRSFSKTSRNIKSMEINNNTITELFFKNPELKQSQEKPSPQQSN